MKRTILGMTTAILLALPAIAQTSDVDQAVMDVLTSNGYPESSFALLTEAEIAEIYLSASSESASDVNEVLAGIDLPSDEASDLLRRSGEPSDVELRVREALDTNGYNPDMVAALSAGDIANIYVSATSGSASDVEEALSSAIDASMTTAASDPSRAERRAVVYLASEGYSDAEIATVDQGELIEIYIALTSNDAMAVDTAVASALES